MNRLPRHAGLAIALALACAAGFAHAQDAAADGYRDRIIAPQQLAPLPPDEDEVDDRTGLPRSLSVEWIVGRTERGDDTFDEQGVSFGGFWDTDGYGSLSLDATLFHSDRDRLLGEGARDGGFGGLATLWQRGFALPGGWRLDNGLGVLNTPSTPLLRSQYRFFLPSVPFAGVGTEARRGPGGLLLQAAAGRAGLYSGTRLLGFETTSGEVASVGAQWDWSPAWRSAVTFLGTQGRIVPDDGGEPVLVRGDTRSLHAATAWEGAAARAQLNLLGSDDNGRDASGAWLDASLRSGRYRHDYGAFRLGEGLAWGAYPISNDIAGGYYRLSYQYARWSWNAGIDRIRSLSGDGFDGRYATGFARYQVNSGLGVGGSLNLRDAERDAYATQWFVDWRNAWGQTRFQADYAGGDDADSWQASVDQALPLREGSRLSLSASHGRLRQAEAATASRTSTFAVYGGHDLGARLSLDGSVRYTDASGEGAIRGSDFNIGLNWEIHPRWVLAAAFYQSRGSQRSPFVLDPIATETDFISLPRDRSMFLSLRYARAAGRPRQVLGGAAGTAAGAIAGSVYLDENRDGVRGAAELPAANVTVVLDGRFAVRTDSLGNYAFPDVAVGRHTISVVADNLPLPWSFEGAEATRTVEVEVRRSVRVDVGARRPQ